MKVANFSTLFLKEDLRFEEERLRYYLANFSWILTENGTSTTRVLLFFKKELQHVSLGRELTSMMVLR